jgi:hypothetical protein
MYYVSEALPMTFDEARMYVFSLGNGWRIPKYDEMKCLPAPVHLKLGSHVEDIYWVDNESAAVYINGRFVGDYIKPIDQKASLIIVKGEYVPYESMRVRTYICPIEKFVQKPSGLHPMIRNMYPEWFEEEGG